MTFQYAWILAEVLLCYVRSHVMWWFSNCSWRLRKFFKARHTTFMFTIASLQSTTYELQQMVTFYVQYSYMHIFSAFKMQKVSFYLPMNVNRDSTILSLFLIKQIHSPGAWKQFLFFKLASYWGVCRKQVLSNLLGFSH